MRPLNRPGTSAGSRVEARPIAGNPAAFHSHCFLCGKRNPRSLKLRFRAAANSVVEARFSGGREFQGYDHFLHGGVIAALLDAAMTHCLFHRGLSALTGDLRVRYKHRIPCDAVLALRAEILLVRPPLYRLRAQVTCGGKIMAWSRGDFVSFRGIS